MLIIPNENYSHVFSTNRSDDLDKTKTYTATWASNQPDYIEDGKVFIDASEHAQEHTGATIFLLEKTEYTVTSKDR